MNVLAQLLYKIIGHIQWMHEKLQSQSVPELAWNGAPPAISWFVTTMNFMDISWYIYRLMQILYTPSKIG